MSRLALGFLLVLLAPAAALAQSAKPPTAAFGDATSPTPSGSTAPPAAPSDTAPPPSPPPAPAPPPPTATAPAPPAPPPPAPSPTAPPPTAPPGYAYPPPPGHVYGYPPPGYPEPRGPKPPDPTARTHDGFYLRLSMGAGRTWGSGTSEISNKGTSDFTLKSSAFAFDLAIGGTLDPSVVVGGLFQFNLGTPTYSYDSSLQQNEQHTQRSLGGFGPFVDWFPDPHGGGHVGAMVGIGNSVDYYDANNQRTSSGGYSAGLFGGYDFWAEDQWSVGGLLRLNYYTLTSRTEHDISEDLKLWNVALMVTVLMH